MRNPYANFVPDRVWACDLPWNTPYREDHARHDFSQLYGPRNIEADLFIEPKILKWGAWLSRRRGISWKHTYTLGYEQFTKPKPWRVSLSIRLLELVDEVPWHNGFPMPRGYYGLVLPRAEAVIANKDKLCWVVLGEPTPRGTYVFIFDSLKLGDDGEPHPRGIFKLSDLTANFLWKSIKAKDRKWGN